MSSISLKKVLLQSLTRMIAKGNVQNYFRNRSFYITSLNLKGLLNDKIELTIAMVMRIQSLKLPTAVKMDRPYLVNLILYVSN